MKLILKLILLLFAIGCVQAEQKQVGENSYELNAGDLLTLPLRSGNTLMLLWGREPLWYDIKDEWLHDRPIRNYTTQIYLQVPRLVEAGDYQFVEIESDNDPRFVEYWKWIKVNNIHVKRCDNFKVC